jgi:hypothetical protein
LNASECDPTQPPDACKIGPGQLANGARCNDSAQCKSGVCNLPQIDVNAALVIGSCGTCATTIAEGQPCMASDTCAAGTACNFALAELCLPGLRRHRRDL